MKGIGLVIFLTVALVLGGCTVSNETNVPLGIPETLPGETIPEGAPGEPRVVTPTSLDGKSNSQSEMDRLQGELNGVEIDGNLDGNIYLDE